MQRQATSRALGLKLTPVKYAPLTYTVTHTYTYTLTQFTQLAALLSQAPGQQLENVLSCKDGNTLVPRLVGSGALGIMEQHPPIPCIQLHQRSHTAPYP